MSGSTAGGGGPLAGRHILLVPSWWPSHESPLAGIFFLDYARAFANAGARVGVLYADLVFPKEALAHALGALALAAPRLVEERLDNAIQVVRVRGLHANLGRAEARTKRAAAWIDRAYRRYVAVHGRPDVVHAHGSIPAAWAALQAVRRVGGGAPPPVIVTEHMGPFSLLLRPDSCAALTREALRGASAIVAVSPNLRAQMVEAGVTRAIEVIPNIAGAEMTPSPSPPIERAGDGRRLLRGIFVGRVEPLKGTRELADAILLVARDPRWAIDWTIVGDGPEAAAMRRRFTDAGIGEHVRWLGVVPKSDVARAIRESHFLALPSYGENCPLAVVEALSVGRPVVGTLGTGSEPLVGPGDGVLCPPRDAARLAGAILELVSGYQRFDAAAIAEGARERFSAGVVARRYAPIFEAATNPT